MADKSNSQPAGQQKAMDNQIPVTPHWFIYLRYGQIGGSLIVLVCAAVSLGAFNSVNGYYLGWGPGFAIFTAIYNLLFLSAIIAVPIFAPQFYFKWFCLGAECFAILWNLISFSGLAVWSTAFSFVEGIDNDSESRVNTVHGATAAGAAFGAFLWISFIVSLVFYSIGCHKCRVQNKSWNTPSNLESMGPVAVQNTGPAYDPAPAPAGYNYPQTQYQG